MIMYTKKIVCTWLSKHYNTVYWTGGFVDVRHRGETVWIHLGENSVEVGGGVRYSGSNIHITGTVGCAHYSDPQLYTNIYKLIDELVELKRYCR